MSPFGKQLTCGSVVKVRVRVMFRQVVVRVWVRLQEINVRLCNFPKIYQGKFAFTCVCMCICVFVYECVGLYVRVHVHVSECVLSQTIFFFLSHLTPFFSNSEWGNVTAVYHQPHETSCRPTTRKHTHSLTHTHTCTASFSWSP